MSATGVLRLAHVITTIERGGAETAVANLVEAQIKFGHFVTVIPLKGSLELFDDFQEMGATIDLSLHNITFASQIILGFSTFSDFDFIHAHLPRSELLVSLTHRNQPYFVTRHNAERFYLSLSKTISLIISRLATRKALAVIAISDTVKRFLRENKEIKKRKKIYVIHYGYRRKLVSAIKKHDESKASLSIGTISRLEEQKNLPFMLLVIKELKSLGIYVNLEIVGVGPQLDSLCDLVEKHKLQENVTFLGKRAKILDFLSAKDIFLMTSHYEGFCRSLLEAIDANVPIVAPNHSTFPEVLGPNHAGLFKPYSLGDCVEKILLLSKDYSVQTQTVRGQQERIEIFSINQYLASHNTLYDTFSRSDGK